METETKRVENNVIEEVQSKLNNLNLSAAVRTETHSRGVAKPKLLPFDGKVL